MALSHRNLRQLKALIWLATLALGGLAGKKLYGIVEDLRAGRFDMVQSNEFEEIVQSQRGGERPDEFKIPPLEFYSRMWSARIHGEEPVEIGITEPLPNQPVVISDVPPLETILQLSHMVYDPIDRTGVATVRYKDPNTEEYSLDEVHLQVGMPLRVPYDEAPYHGQLAAIDAKGAWFRWGEEEVLLGFELPDPTAPAATDSGSRSEGLSDKERESLERYRDRDETVDLGSDMYLVGTDDRELFRTDYNLVLRNAGVRNETDASGKSKVVLGYVKPNSLAGRGYGFKSGDELISINGNPVTTRNQAINWARENPGLPKYVVEYRRGGAPRTKTILVPQDD